MEARWLSGRASDSGPRGPEFEPHDRCVVSLRKVQAGFQFEGKSAKHFAPDRSVSPIMVVKREVYFGIWRRGGSVVERRTRDLEAPSSNPTTAV